MPEHEYKKCPRCGTFFECKLGSITICQCTDIAISETVKTFVQDNYDDCLCIRCLQQLQEKFEMDEDFP